MCKDLYYPRGIWCHTTTRKALAAHRLYAIQFTVLRSSRVLAINHGHNFTLPTLLEDETPPKVSKRKHQGFESTYYI